jgi:hypothetical protein
MTVLDEIGRNKYVSLVTYRRAGTGVATLVWHVMRDGDVVVVSDADAGKVKWIGNGAMSR